MHGNPIADYQIEGQDSITFMHDYSYLGKKTNNRIVQKYSESMASQGQGSQPPVAETSCYPGNRSSFSNPVLKDTYI